MKTKLVTLTLAVMMLAVLFSGSGKKESKNDSKNGSKELTKVVVSEFRGISWSPMYIAYQLGYYKEEGLDIELTVLEECMLVSLTFVFFPKKYRLKHKNKV